MLDVCLLGTGGMMPLPHRHLTSLMLRCSGSDILIDCGEGTQIAIKKKGWSANPIDVICFTHYHADHISGLVGLLLSIGNSERTRPITMIGPKGLKRVVESLRVIAPELPFEIIYRPLEEDEEHIDINGYTIHAFKLRHNVLCYGYSVELKRAGKFSVENATKLNIPKPLWGRLQKGEQVEYGGLVYTPDMVMGEQRRGLKVTYCTDTRPVPVIEKYARDADLFICEGMYAEKEKLAKAKQYKHMTFYEAAQIAANSNPKQMWLTHYSPSLNDARPYLPQVRKIFPRTYLGKDGKSLELTFDKDE